jgi:hypothetical protein
MHVLWTSAFRVAIDIRRGAACCQQIKSHREFNLDDHDVRPVLVSRICLALVSGRLRHNLGKGNLHVWRRAVRSCVSFGIFLPYDLFDNTIFKDAEAKLHLLNPSSTSDSL